MGGVLIQRRRQPQHRVAGKPLHRRHTRQPWRARGQGAGFVEQHRAGARQPFQHSAAFDDDAALRRARYAADQRHRGGQNHRAGRCHHQHRQRPCGGPGGPPGEPGHQHRQPEKPQRPDIGEPDHRWPLGFRRMHQPHHGGIGPGGLRRGGQQFKRAAGIDHAAAHGLPGRAADRQRLPGQGGFVQHCRRIRQPAIHRHRFPRFDQQPVAGLHAGGGDVVQPVWLDPVGGAWGARQQGGKFPPRPRFRQLLQRAAAGDHDGDNRRRQRFAQRRRADDGEQGDQIDADFAVAQPAQEIHRHHHRLRRTGQQPARGDKRRWCAEQPGPGPGQQSQQRSRQQPAAEMALRDHWP